jgi:DivIVA domain-containing protein
MSEEGFRLTPVDVRGQEFARTFWGYDRADVEEFRNRVGDELERLSRERTQLEERVHNLREQLKAYRDREKAINEAVLMTQEVRQDAEQAAKRQLELVSREAKVKADQIVAAARARETAVLRDLETAQHDLSGYLTAFRNLLHRYLAQVDALGQHERDGTPPEAP